ncbi:MAG: hypothetical protein QW057_02795, partial [Candidatus Bathyarchaeia archaeon]
MRKTQTLTISLLIGVMAIHLAAFAQAAPTKAVVKALVVEARASAAGTPYSKYNISANTTDGGRVEFLFVWQRSIEWNLKGFSGKLIVDTQPILHMAKYNKNGTLEVSLSYVPLFVMQYNDSDGNGLFDLWTRGGKGFDDEVEDDEIAWEHLKDRPYRIYPLAPMFHMIFRQSKWEWTVSSLVNRTIVVNNTQVEEFSWNITATVPSIPWQHAEVDEEERLRRRGLEWTTIDITLGYHVKLLPENPEVKYDLAFANINWADAENLRLAMISAILYRDVEPVVVKLGSRGLKVF